MIKLSSPKESICFNFENDEQKNFFDKAKKCDIINNNNSVFLRKILSVKNPSLLEETLKESKSQIFNYLNTYTYNPNKLNLNYNNSSSNLTIRKNKEEDSFNNIQSPKICLYDINLNNSFKIDISPKKVFSPKIIVNKNKKLGFHIQKEKETNKEQSLYSDQSFFSEKDNNIIKNKYNLNTINTAFNLNPEISFSNLYNKNYIRKPVVIKFKNGLNNTNIKNQNNLNNKQDFSDVEDKENIQNNNQILKKVKTENKIKPYNFYKEKNLETELYRNYEDLEKKSMEIFKRKKKKSSFNLVQRFKKEDNLEELKESLENYRIKTKYKLKRKKKKKDNFINFSNNNAKNKSIKTNKNKNDSHINLNPNKTKNNKLGANNFSIKKQTNINANKNIYWNKQKNTSSYNIYNSYINGNKPNKITKNIPKVKSEELLIRKANHENIKKKNIKINIIEENKTENIYNITLNTNNVNEAFNRFHMSLNYNPNFKNKNYIIRQKYGKKNNINENIRIKEKNNKYQFKKDLYISQLINKIYTEDNKIKNNISKLSHCFSHGNLVKKENEKQIKVNKKNNSGKKLIKINTCQYNIDDILDLEEKVNKEINDHLKIIKGIEIMDEFLIYYNKKLVKKIFDNICNYYFNQIGAIHNTTILSNKSRKSELKYTKKIVTKKNNLTIEYNNSNNNIIRNKSFNKEKQRISSLKRKVSGTVEKYEHYSDFIINLRLFLINYSLSKNGFNN